MAQAEYNSRQYSYQGKEYTILVRDPDRLNHLNVPFVLSWFMKRDRPRRLAAIFSVRDASKLVNVLCADLDVRSLLIKGY